MLFSVGGMFAVYEGYEKIKHPHEIEAWYWPVGVLVFAIIAEGFSFRTAIKESNETRGALSWTEFIRRAKAPELPVVLLEDFGALIGLVLALAGVGLAIGTGDGVWDGIGTLCIGILLIAIAIVLAAETKSLLLGEAAGTDQVEKIKAAVVDGDTVTGIIHMRTLHLGPEELLVAAKIAVQHDDTATEVANAINAAESRIREAVPIARVIYLEPDIYNEAAARSGTNPAKDATTGPATDDKDSAGKPRTPRTPPTRPKPATERAVLAFESAPGPGGLGVAGPFGVDSTAVSDVAADGGRSVRSHGPAEGERASDGLRCEPLGHSCARGRRARRSTLEPTRTN